VRFALPASLRRFYEHLVYDLPLKYKLIVSFSVIMLIPVLLLGLSSGNLMQNNLQEMEKKALLQSIRQLSISIDYFLNTYYNASSLLLRNRELQGVLNMPVRDLKDAIAARKQADIIVSQVQAGLELSESISISNLQSNDTIRFYITNEPLATYLGDILPLDEIRSEPWFDRVYTPYTVPVWQSRVMLNSQPNVVLNRKIIDFSTYQEMGVMRVFIPVIRLQTYVSRNAPPGSYSIYYVDDSYDDILITGIDTTDQILAMIKASHFDKELNSMTIGGRGYLVGIIRSPITGWRLIYVTPTDTITEKTRFISGATVAAAGIALALCIVISIIFSGFFTRRIAILVNKTNQVDKGDLTIQQRIKGHDEIGQLDLNFNNMIRRIDHLIQNEFRAKLAINKVRLELLQTQINPHLLYNTLSLISMISKEDGRQEVLNVTNNLIGFYRGILSRGKIIASFREEINMVRMYIDLMRTVYQLDIESIIEIDEAIYDCYSIKLLLQPVVENAILHGLRQKGGGQIFISGEFKGNGIEFVISDNGVGMPDEIKHFLNSVLEMQEMEKSYGLANVIKRVALFWGRDYGVSVESAPGAGTTVILRIPRLTEEEITERLESKYLI
jgi:sensor histidine kinase YesM